MNVPLAIVSRGGLLVGRPAGVAHVYAGPLTPSGRWVPRGGRTACCAHTRRLAVLVDPKVTAVPPVAALGSESFRAGRRVCARCLTHLARTATPLPVSRDGLIAAYGHLTVDQLRAANALTVTVDESSVVGRVAMAVAGPAGCSPAPAAEWKRLDDEINVRRRALASAARTPDEIAAAQRDREAGEHNDALAVAGRKRAARLERLQGRAARGQYLTASERALLAT